MTSKIETCITVKATLTLLIMNLHVFGDAGFADSCLGYSVLIKNSSIHVIFPGNVYIIVEIYWTDLGIFIF